MKSIRTLARLCGGSLMKAVGVEAAWFSTLDPHKVAKSVGVAS